MFVKMQIPGLQSRPQGALKYALSQATPPPKIVLGVLKLWNHCSRALHLMGNVLACMNTCHKTGLLYILRMPGREASATAASPPTP